MGENPYTVERQEGGCAHCGANQMFDVVYHNGKPDEVAMSVSFGDEEPAIDLCDQLNAAHQRAGTEVIDLKAEIVKAQAACAEMAVMLSIYADSNNFIKGNDWVWNGEDDPTLAAKKALDESNPGAALLAELEALRKVAEALQGIIDIGKRDTTNPKYDGYYVTAKEALAAAKEPHAG